jgi:cell division cycle 2-like protein
MASRWANDEADAAESARRKKEKEEKKRAKLLKQQQAEAEARESAAQEDSSRPSKRRRLSAPPEGDASKAAAASPEKKLLRFEGGGWGPCRHVTNFETLNHIEEGSYGWVSRAREVETGEVVALKKVKMDYVNDGFPITALREISILQKAKHRNIVDLKEVVMGDAFDE